MKQRVEEMEAEARKLRELQAAAAESSAGSEDVSMEEDKSASDSRSVYVGNVRGSCSIRNLGLIVSG